MKKQEQKPGSKRQQVGFKTSGLESMYDQLGLKENDFGGSATYKDIEIALQKNKSSIVVSRLQSVEDNKMI